MINEFIQALILYQEAIENSIYESLKLIFYPLTIGLFFGICIGIILIGLERVSSIFIKPLSFILNAIFQILTFFPFVIWMILFLPATRYLLGTSIGPESQSFTIAIWATAVFAHLLQRNFTDPCSKYVFGIRIINCLVILVLCIISASFITGILGSGGLGDLLINYGYMRFNIDIIIFVSLITLAVVFIILLISWILIGILKHYEKKHLTTIDRCPVD